MPVAGQELLASADGDGRFGSWDPAIGQAQVGLLLAAKKARTGSISSSAPTPPSNDPRSAGNTEQAALRAASRYNQSDCPSTESAVRWHVGPEIGSRSVIGAGSRPVRT